MYKRFPKFIKPKARECKICMAPSPIYGAIDFNKAGETWLNYRPQVNGDLVFYNRCSSCGFVFSSSFDKWSKSDFVEFIYNEFYHRIDAGSGGRNESCASFIQKRFGHLEKEISILDYGGGDGHFAGLLVGRGFSNVSVYEPFVNRFGEVPSEKFDLITCYEVMEHVPDPDQTVSRMASLSKEGGVILFSTLIQPGYFDECGVFWWYVAPRAGHISIYSNRSLSLLWGKYGFSVAEVKDNIDGNNFIAFRTFPDMLNSPDAEYRIVE